VLNVRGFAYLKSGQADKSVADYDAVIRIEPKNAAAVFGRGMAKLKKNDKAGGEADVAAAKAIKPDIAEEFARFGVK